MVTQTGAAQGAIIGACLGVGIIIVMMILFLLMYTRTKILDDTNIRRRIVTYSAFDQTPPARVEYAPEPAPPPPPPPALPRTYIDEEAPQPLPTRVRRRSWSGVPDDNEWVLVKTIKKNKHTGVQMDTEEKADSSSSDDDEEETRKVKHCRKKRSMMPMATMYPRLAPYDLAMPMSMYQARPAMMGGGVMGGAMMGGGYMMSRPQVTAMPAGMATMPAAMPMYAAPATTPAQPVLMGTAVSTFQPGYMPYYSN